jgi:hypothetical protein
LGGRMVLPKSSCSDCSQITSRFELTCARTSFGPFRVHHGFPTRRPARRPRTIPLERRLENGIVETHTLPVAKYPNVLFLLKFGHTAGILLGDLPEHESVVIPWIGVGNPSSLTKGDKAAKFDAFAFARLVAKIGLGMASIHPGVDNFRPLSTDFILGRSDQLAQIVGGTAKVEPATKCLHWLRLRDHIDLVRRRHFLVAHVRLFSNVGTPSYHCVVGERPFGSPLLRTTKIN